MEEAVLQNQQRPCRHIRHKSMFACGCSSMGEISVFVYTKADHYWESKEPHNSHTTNRNIYFQRAGTAINMNIIIVHPCTLRLVYINYCNNVAIVTN